MDNKTEYIYEAFRKKETQEIDVNTLEGDINEIIDHWNIIGISQIKKRESAIPFIKQSLKYFSKKDILITVDRYAKMYNDPEYFFDYRYLPSTFYNRVTIGKFVDEGPLWASYCHWIEKRKTKENVVKEKVFYEIELYDKIIELLSNLNYTDYLNTKHWKHFSHEALIHFNHTCQLCNTKNEEMHVHHKTYENRGRETFNDVIVLCAKCHKIVHGIDNFKSK